MYLNSPVAFSLNEITVSAAMIGTGGASGGAGGDGTGGVASGAFSVNTDGDGSEGSGTGGGIAGNGGNGGGGIIGGFFELFDLSGSTIVPENTNDFPTETDIDGSPGSAVAGAP